jgi:Na+/alanine symporter
MTEPEQPESLVEETVQGRSARTPLLAHLGVATIVGIAVAIVVGGAFLAYYLAR